MIQGEHEVRERELYMKLSNLDDDHAATHERVSSHLSSSDQSQDVAGIALARFMQPQVWQFHRQQPNTKPP